ncbi:MAG: ABC transporter permease [candidate division Zixibacteria bacterium]|nr:ABC transporter permease [candidate division Zixibacteria bacterium]
MNPSILFNVFLRDFRKQKKRMILTLVAILWGTMSIMLLLAFGEGLKRQFAVNERGLGEGIVIMWSGQTAKPYQGFGKGRRIWLRNDDIEYLRRRMPELETVAGEYSRWGATIKYGTKVLNDRICGIYPEYRDMRNFIPATGGRMIDKLDIDLKRRVAFLGDRSMARLFGEEMKPENVIGERIYLNGTPFTVIGVMVHKLQMSSYEGQDADMVSIPATTFETIFHDPYLDYILYKPKTADNMAGVEKRVFEVMGTKYKFDPTDDRALRTWDLVEEKRTTDAVMFGIEVFLGVIGFLTLFIAGVGVANIMYVSIRERTREIGVKMAVGARRIYILMQFIVEALGITFLGGLLGMGVAYVLTELFKLAPMDSEALMMLGRPTVSLEIGLVVTIILGILGFLAGLFPALKAASINPTEALRYE